MARQLEQDVGIGIEHRQQVAEPRDTLGGNDAVLGQMPPHRAYLCRTLAHQQVAGPVQHEHALRRGRLDRHKARRRARHRFADRLRIGRVVPARSAMVVVLDVISARSSPIHRGLPPYRFELLWSRRRGGRGPKEFSGPPVPYRFCAPKRSRRLGSKRLAISKPAAPPIRSVMLSAKRLGGVDTTTSATRRRQTDIGRR